METTKTVTIGHPEKLKTLLVNELFLEGQQDYSRFTSLTKLYTSSRNLQNITPHFLAKLPSLEELFLHRSYFFMQRPTDAPRLPKPSFSPKAKPRIFYFGFEIDTINLEAEFFSGLATLNSASQASARFITQNIHRSIYDNFVVYSTHYNLLASELNDFEMFEVMFQKFPKIYKLYVIENVENQSRLLRFVDKFKQQDFHFERTSLQRSFFEKFAKNRLFIRRLEFWAEPSMNILSGDFDFIFKLRYLTDLKFFDFLLPLNFIVRVLKEIKSILLVSFSKLDLPENNFHFRIIFSGLNSFYLSGPGPDDNLSYKFSDKEEGLDLLNDANDQLKADGFVCVNELLAWLRRREIEKRHDLLMMRRYIYEQKHSVCLSKQQMRLLNFHC